MTTSASILRLGDRVPSIDPTAFIATGVVVVGDVTVGAEASIWYNSVVRGDIAPITIGDRTNIQDGCVLHADPGAPLILGRRVTVGHRVVLHGAIVGDDVLIGMGAVVMNNAHIGAGSIIGAGALVTQDTVVPEGSLVLGSPAKVVRPVTDEERDRSAHGSAHYSLLAQEHRAALSVDDD
jgi:carbonic anhydrase/acetyltransferase-like protein (isoleucine patch superfamily)